MKPSEALMILLIEWAWSSFGDESEDCIYDLFLDEINSKNKDLPEHEAKMVWFGTYQPEDDEISIFMEKYRNYMMAIYHNRQKIMLGEVLIETILIEVLVGFF